MSTTSFTQVGSTPLFLPTGTSAGAESNCLFIATGTAPASPLSLSDALAAEGGIVFLPGLPTVTNQLDWVVSALQATVKQQAQAGQKVFWFASNDLDQITSTQNALEITVSGNKATVGDPAPLALNNIILTVAGQSTVAEVNGDLVITPAGTNHAFMVQPIYASQTSVNFNGAITLVVLSDPQQAGTFTGTHDFTSRLADALVAGPMYTYVEGQSSQEPANYLAYQLVDFSAAGMPAQLEMTMCFDVNQTSLGGRTKWLLTNTQFASNYVNALGMQMGLMPNAGAGFSLAQMWMYSQEAGSDTFGYIGTPIGDFDLDIWNGGAAAAGAPTVYQTTLMPGLSGSEYYHVGGNGAKLSFAQGYDAYIPSLSEPQNNLLASASTGSPIICAKPTSYATTSRAKLVGSAAIPYYSQPMKAMQHEAPASATPAGTAAFMNYLALSYSEYPAPTNELTQDDTHCPMTPYKGLNINLAGQVAGDAEALTEITKALETQILAPMRKTVMDALPSSPSGLAAASPQTGVTPQGFELQIDGNTWTTMTMAQPTDPNAPVLKLNNVRGDLKNAMMTNALFAPISSVEKFQASADTDYALTTSGLNALVAQKKISSADETALQSLVGTTYTSKADFTAAIETAIPDKTERDKIEAALYESAAGFSITIAGWTFDIAPETWDEHGTILIFKFTDQPMSNLVGSTNSWYGSGTPFSDNPTQTQQTIQAYIADAREQAKKDGDMAEFVEQVLDNPYWQGVLAINAYVPLTKLPAELEGLAAGIDARQFYAHHVGVRMTPIMPSATSVEQKRSNTFGLINYQSPQLLSTSTNYDFKVLILKVVFQNAALTGFSSQISLLINNLFGDGMQASQGATANNLVFNGSYQNSGGSGNYVFTTAEEAIFRSQGAVLGNVVINQAQFNTLTPSAEQVAENQVSTQFLITGALQFQSLPVDLIGYGSDAGNDGGLAIEGLAITMDFDSATPAYKSFAFVSDKIVLSSVQTKKRKGSLVAHFPIKLTGLKGGPGTAKPSGYMPVDIAFSSSGIGNDWYGLEYELNLGGLGSLASTAGFVAKFLIGWSPGPASGGNYPVYVGLGLPGVKGGNRAISLESVIKLSFGGIALLSDGDSYVLKIANIALRLLSFTFPQVGQTGLYIFGDPKDSSGTNAGWYGGYAKAGKVINGSGKQTPIGEEKWQ